MRWKHLKGWSLAAVAIGGLLGYVLYENRAALPLPRPTPVRFDTATFKQLRPGMKRATVEYLLEGPPGDYCPECIYASQMGDKRNPVPPEAAIWVNEYGEIAVAFDPEGKVTSAVWNRVHVHDKR